MEKKITMSEVISFKEVANDFKSKTLPLQGAYKLMKISNALDKETEFYQTKFQEIVETYAKKDDEGNYVYSDDGSQIVIQDGKVEECNNELEKLMDMEVTIDNMDFTIENLGEDIECTPEELEGLMPLLN